ncbi:hypothetical protein EDB81DRAFT_624776, partial [Dactylonectria macrodidyma]
MKSSFAMLALVASLGEVSATFGKWKDASKYTTPGNSNNQCDDTQKGGWNWDDLDVGNFDSYNDWNFSGGWSCQQDSRKRSLDGRTFGKSISGSCGSDASTAPSFSCGSSGNSVSSFSVKTFDIRVEFDCRMEFHYEMNDGSTCKQSADCSSEGTTIDNTQCGGAKKVTFVYPVQDKPKSNCEIEIPSIDFDCDDSDTTSTVPVVEQSSTIPYGSGETSTVPYGGETSSIPVGQDTTVPYGGETTSVPVEGETTTPYG